MKRRVVITGLGALTPIGNTVSDTWSGIREGKCGIDKITHFDTTEFKAKLAGEIKDLDMEQYFSKRDLKFNDRFTQLARIAAKQAMEDSALDVTAIDANRFGVIIASGIGGIESIENAQDTLNDRGPSRVSPFFIPMALVNLAAGNVAIDVGAKGHCSSQVTACAAGSNAIGEAFHKIRDGYEDVMLAGGSEASITPLAIAGFASMRALHTGEDPTRASIPFDKDRSGFVMGEGAGVLVLEELEQAKKRNAKIYAEIIGYGSSCDAHHITAPIDDGSGGAQAMVRAIDDANISADKVSYINAHGTSTPLNDKTETMAIKSAFKDHAYNLAVSSTKSNTGHLLGASGAVEAIITLKAVQENFIPATINYQNSDEDCDLDIVPNKGREEEVNCAMSNSLGFGGHNVSLIFKKWEEA
ncbi:beta-ketoacyl-ACP synthase II [Breznakia pachnodae]|uniref:3-oxoacyl-[acyl-carrier-protein] synthase 2 n=1 Tax=Breznakia pachnodae TaxID=265178 RepID=A0ABU0DZ41_9FIRM|nr:beta-ketoacyl-ACP synthase II [Breznakia pachnodae]MDQ0359753.1 3-oxoacyl-[acyl-carrier-protein] synthase II [Breznakia pachnodae]